MTDANDDSLRRLTGYRLHRAAIHMQAAVVQALRPLGLRRTTYSVLQVIDQCPGLRQAELARVLDIERPNLTKIVGELEAEGWITRKPFDADGRAYALFVTERGAALRAQAFDVLRTADAAMLKDLTAPQIEDLHAALEVIEGSAVPSGPEGSRGGA